MHPYRNFVLMIATSSIVMLVLMYLNTFVASHVWFSETRVFMTLIMAGGMTLVMLTFMRAMLENRRTNAWIAAGGVALLGSGIWLVRSQATVDDIAYMKGMIPHHSIALLTSERARIEDPRVRELADDIIKTQREEIALMEALIADIEANGPRLAR
jgi:hypothetical protein